MSTDSVFLNVAAPLISLYASLRVFRATNNMFHSFAAFIVTAFVIGIVYKATLPSKGAGSARRVMMGPMEDLVEEDPMTDPVADAMDPEEAGTGHMAENGEFDFLSIQ
jgi:hypothetical protein